MCEKAADIYQYADGIKTVPIRNFFASLGCIGGGVESCDLACETIPKRSQSMKVNKFTISNNNILL